MQTSAGVAWITGGGTGIGRALALRLAAAGWQVAISGRRPGPLAETVHQQPERLTAYPLDVTDPTAVRETVTQIEAALGPLNLVVLNAGLGQFVKLSEYSAELAARHMQVNYLGAVNGLDAVLPGLRQRHAGHIVLMASLAGQRGLPRGTVYGPTKAALINLAEALRFELEREGITITVCNPGYVDTAMTRENKFSMPFLMSAERAAGIIHRGILRRKFEITFPRRLSLTVKLLRCLPYPLYFFLMKTFYSH